VDDYGAFYTNRKRASNSICLLVKKTNNIEGNLIMNILFIIAGTAAIVVDVKKLKAVE